ncbi:glycosyltransferase [Natrononativus amylolyticus]|uniref:glycosyltransferase n=1 Tax=Natrononativus amylolyticus TaxID=2963434 RepID=UPI0020CE5AD0|nr:glycosyltransferase [Natrononativus amylolyticus]
MSQESINHTSIGRSEHDLEAAYALGLVVTDQDDDTVFRTVLEARRAAFEVYVVPLGCDATTTELLGTLEVSLVDHPECSTRADAYDRLEKAAQLHSLDGIAVGEPGGEFDFAALRRDLSGESAFTLEAAAYDTAQETGRLVGIPAYNESVGIGSTVIAAQQYADEVVVIDDGSGDDTVDIARETSATVLEHGVNQGKGAALRTFFEYAQESDHDSFVVLDGDGQHLPEDIPEVVAPVEEGEVDMVVGSRYLEGGEDETPLYRRVGQQTLDYLTLGSSGAKLTDTQSGFRAFSARAIDRLALRTDGMGVESEMIGSAMEEELAIEEVPIDVRYEGIDGQTFNPLRHGFGVATFVLQLIRDRHPLVFFGAPGLAFTIVGLAFGVSALLMYSSQGAFAIGQVLVSVFFTLVGVLGVFCGLILNRISNMIDELKEAAA